jgi:hypothetical protein
MFKSNSTVEEMPPRTMHASWSTTRSLGFHLAQLVHSLLLTVAAIHEVAMGSGSGNTVEIAFLGMSCQPHYFIYTTECHRSVSTSIKKRET